MAEYLKEKCFDSSKEAQSYAVCWALAAIYQTLLDTRQHPQGQEDKSKTKSVHLVRDEEEAEPKIH